MIKILVDSASDIDIQEAQTKGVELIPLPIRFGNDEYLDGVNLSHRQFFEKLIESDELPQTSMANAERFTEEFTRLTADGSQVLAITISSKLSGTYENAKRAAKNFKGKVFAVDSLNASIGERVLCEYAIELVKQNKLSAEQIVAELENKRGKIQVMAVLDTLKYLKKGGRISSVQAIAGEMFSIKPVISIVNGEVKLVGKAMGSRKGNNLLNQLIEKCGGVNFELPFAVAYSGLSDDYLQKYLNDSKSIWAGNTKFIPSYMIGSAIGTHVGPNAIAVAFFAK
jgi:DegV family protein with EDD domain